jgi:hypothetical protein
MNKEKSKKDLMTKDGGIRRNIYLEVQENGVIVGINRILII